MPDPLFQPMESDGLHLTAESQKKLGVAVAAKVKEILK